MPSELRSLLQSHPSTHDFQMDFGIPRKVNGTWIILEEKAAIMI